ncbi:MAG: hydroxyphenylacetyl-CoA thioesterase PaaI [Caldimonas sp.]
MTTNHAIPAASPSPETVVAHMFAADRASRALGMRIVAVGEGTARVEMAVRDDMLNSHEICHGGFITTLADSAFAFACNARNHLTVAAGLSVEFLTQVKRGEVLTADAVEVSLRGRSGVYDIVVTNQDGVRVALVRGRSASLRGRTVMPAATDDRKEA